MRTGLFWMFLLSAGWIGSVHAVESWRPTPAEMPSLPPYCAAKWNGGPEAARWKAEYGPDYMHVHHYCVGLNSLSRYYRSADPKKKEEYLRTAMAQWDYMLSHAKPSSHHYWNYYFQKGSTLLLMRRSAEAIKEFQSALAHKPDASEVYLKLADIYKGQNKPKDALEIIAEALRRAPDVKILQKRYLELGGNEPFPEPYKKAAQTEEPVAPPPGNAARSEEKQQPATVDNQPVTPEAGVAAKAPPPVEPARIGTPKNPWCRFCVDEPERKADQPPSTSEAGAATGQ